MYCWDIGCTTGDLLTQLYWWAGVIKSVEMVFPGNEPPQLFGRFCCWRWFLIMMIIIVVGMKCWMLCWQWLWGQFWGCCYWTDVSCDDGDAVGGLSCVYCNVNQKHVPFVITLIKISFLVAWICCSCSGNFNRNPAASNGYHINISSRNNSEWKAECSKLAMLRVISIISGTECLPIWELHTV